jgi:hypothetical protein
VEQVGRGDLREADTAQEILKPGIGLHRIKSRPREDEGFVLRMIGVVHAVDRCDCRTDTTMLKSWMGIQGRQRHRCLIHLLICRVAILRKWSS